MRQPTSWLHQLLGATIILAVSAWLISWAVTLLTPLLPVMVFVGLLVGVVVVVRGVIQRRRYW